MTAICDKYEQYKIMIQ